MKKVYWMKYKVAAFTLAASTALAASFAVSSAQAADLKEIRFGVEAMPAGRRRERLSAWLTDDLPARFDGRIIEISQQVALSWGVVMARCKHAGAPIGTMDAFFAATAQVHGFALVTRDVRDFKATGIELLDPWQVG